MTCSFNNKLPLEGLIEILPQRFDDARGFFLESYNRLDFSHKGGIHTTFVQDNHSCSSKGVLRGIHFQRGEAAQAKLVRVLAGAVWDVAVDLRKDSSTFMEWYGTELSAENQKMLYIPRGFGHGFLTLEDNTHFLYKCDNHYSREAEGGVLYNDSLLGIDWPEIDSELHISPKDMELLPFTEVVL